MDPTDERVPVSRQITPRNGPIKGCVALLDISKPRGNVLLDRVEDLIAQRLPEVDRAALCQADVHQACSGSAANRDSRKAADFVIEGLAD